MVVNPHRTVTKPPRKYHHQSLAKNPQQTQGNIHILDNECSQDLKNAFKKYNVDFQRVPPHSHRCNAAERTIQTWKNHFITGLSSCDPKFPLSEWDHLLPQAEITLNLLRSSRRLPNLLAHACLFGNYDFNRCALAPPGTKYKSYHI